jgi:hypothetical protein
MRISARDCEMIARRRYQSWWEVSRKAERRQKLRDSLETYVHIAQGLTEAGVDPDRVKALQRGIEVYEVLQEIGDTPELAEADQRLLALNPMPSSGRLGPAQQRDRESLRRLAQSYADGRELDVEKCTMAEAQAFCVARLCPEEWGLTPGVRPAQSPEGAEATAAPVLFATEAGQGGDEDAREEI